MSIFDSIKNAIFGHKTSPTPSKPAAAPPPSTASTTRTATAPTSTAAPQKAPPTAAAPPVQPVDVEAVLEELSGKKTEKLNWRTSIVDLMKVLDIDSSIGHRKELAKEFGYTGDTNDSAAMNIWLHKQVMKKLADNGGKVPSALRD